MTRNLACLALLSLIAACGTPQEQCIARNTGEYRTVSALLAEVEGNLARGYAWDERQVTSTTWDECRDVFKDKDGNTVISTRPCLRDTVETERFRVPIDPTAEQRKRDNLAAKQKQLALSAKRATEACKQAFPE